MNSELGFSAPSTSSCVTASRQRLIRFEKAKEPALEVTIQVFRLYFELYMMGFPINLKSLITTFLKCVRNA